MRIFKMILIFSCWLLSSFALADSFSSHRANIDKIEVKMKTLDKELEEKVASKKKTRDQARVEEILQRIVEIHGELITLRKDLDNELRQVKADHFEEGKAMNLFSDVESRLSVGRRKKPTSPLQVKMNSLFRKIQSKYASFVAENAGSETLKKVETVVETQKGKRKSKEAEVYLRKKSEVELSK